VSHVDLADGGVDGGGEEEYGGGDEEDVSLEAVGGEDAGGAAGHEAEQEEGEESELPEVGVAASYGLSDEEGEFCDDAGEVGGADDEAGVLGKHGVLEACGGGGEGEHGGA